MNDAVQKPARINWPNLITIVSAAILIGVEVIGIGIATGWALATLFSLGTAIEYALMAVFGLAALAFTWYFVRNAARIEPIIER
jgi:Flp pilus assembly pilin Flp